jgi:AcrR family transcriptional regulator
MTMPPTPSTVSTRDRIVETAFRLFLTQGYERTSTAQLVAATGLSKGAIYHHFRDKEEIRAATIEHFLLRYLAPPEPDTHGEAVSGDAVAGRAGETRDDTATGDAGQDRSGADLATLLRHVADAYASLLETVAGVTDDPLAYHRFVLASAPGLRDPVRAASEELRDALTAAARTSQRAGSITTTIPARRIAEGAAAVVEGAGLLWSLDPQGPVRERLRSVVDDHLAVLAATPGS